MVTTRTLVLLPILLLVLVGLFLVLRPDSPAPESSTSAGETQEQTFDLAINEGVLNPEEISVEEGDRVNLRITTDEPFEFHLHGYDLEAEVEPDEPVELSFDATTTSRFEIENHSINAVLGALLVQPR
jgi:hypothetical protein